MPHHELRNVFGVHAVPPEQTYVDRAGLDGRIKYLLSTGRHLVIYGPSKQGKTALRRRAIPDDECVIIQSRQKPNTEAIYDEILRGLGISRTVNNEVTKGREFSITGGGSGGVSIPFLGKGEAKAEGQAGISHEATTTTEPVGNTPSNLAYVAEEIRNLGRRIVIEDFHYIPELAKRTFAVDLKALFEYGVSIVLIGAWEEQHVLVAYNGDLAGRVDEINLRWTDEELREVLNKGQAALNIEFSTELLREIISDASGNVGLLQRIAEKLCIEAGCYRTEEGETLTISDKLLLQVARKHICSEEAVRYRNFGWSVSEGFPNSKEKSKTVYMRIIQVCVEATEAELLAGLTQNQIVERIVAMDPSITPRNVRESLQRIDRLQSEKAIYPIIATYNMVSRTLHLADRELLFYRKYGGPRWPWEDADDE
jgi:hypothetical protein